MTQAPQRTRLPDGLEETLAAMNLTVASFTGADMPDADPVTVAQIASKMIMVCTTGIGTIDPERLLYPFRKTGFQAVFIASAKWISIVWIGTGSFLNTANGHHVQAWLLDHAGVDTSVRYLNGGKAVLENIPKDPVTLALVLLAIHRGQEAWRER